MNQRMMFELVEGFKTERTRVIEESRAGRPSTWRTEEQHIQRKYALIGEDRRISLVQVAENRGHQLS